MTRHPSRNVTISWDRTGGTSYLAIGQLKDISGPDITRDTFEVTDRDVTGNYKEYWGGYADGGAITFDWNWDPINITTHGAGTSSILANFSDADACAAKAAWQVQADLCGGTATWTFDGILDGYSMDSPEEGVLGGSLSVKISGEPTLTVT